MQHRFRVIRGGLDEANTDSKPDPDNLRETSLGPELRSLYAPPSESYWDGFEARVMAAVRVGRTAPVSAVETAVEWWHTLANWARPGMAAAAVLIGMIGGIALQTSGARSESAARAAAEYPANGGGLEPMDEELARASDAILDANASSEAKAQARAASELLSDGVKRRTGVRIDFDGPTTAPSSTPDSAGAAVKARREATFRYVMP